LEEICNFAALERITYGKGPPIRVQSKRSRNVYCRTRRDVCSCTASRGIPPEENKPRSRRRRQGAVGGSVCYAYIACGASALAIKGYEIAVSRPLRVQGQRRHDRHCGSRRDVRPRAAGSSVPAAEGVPGSCRGRQRAIR